MEKILLAIDGISIDMPTLDFACYMAKLTGSKLTGVFLENLVANERSVFKSVHGIPSYESEIDTDSPELVEKNKIIERNIQLFKDACEKRSTPCTVHCDRGVPANEIISESRYADLVIVDADTSFNRRFEGTPTEFVKDVLKDSECPVIIAPEVFEGINEIIFTYDASKSAAFAIKQFSYLLPQFEDKKITILQVNKQGEWKDIDKYNLWEWLHDRYSAIGFVALEGESTDRLFAYLFQKRNVFIVMGAYSRSALSRFLKHSHADLLMRTITQPIFISHY